MGVQGETDSLAGALARSFGHEAVAVAEGQVQEAHTKGRKWVFENVGGAVRVEYAGDDLAFVDDEELVLRVVLGCRVVGNQPVLDEPGETQDWVEGSMWPTWEARGYAIDESCSPGNGWDADDECYLLNVKKVVGDFGALVAELRWAAAQEVFQFIEGPALPNIKMLER
ncbi:MAG: hypothetical protein EP329_08865 [Deltaproteobacteria bacterium]|nr:MAG: hypothetical protein EP329_08865 [Deltaproteobacteria bacterium]